MKNIAVQWKVRLLWSFFFPGIIFLRGARSQFNIYGVNIELVKMRLIRQPFYVQEYQLQVDYTHRNKVIDYGVVTVGGVQDQTDFIFIESINRNPFHLPKVEVQGDVCFRLFVQNGDVLFDECIQIRDLPGGSPYYNSKYVTRTKNDGSLLMYKYIQFMVDNRDENRALLEQSLVNSHLNSLLGHCSCTASIVIASFEGAVILIAALSIFYYCKFYEKRRKKSSINKVAISSPTSGIYADNAITTTSIAWGTYYASNPVSGNANYQTNNTAPLQKSTSENLKVDKLAITSNTETNDNEGHRFKLKANPNDDLQTKISKSIVDQIMAKNGKRKKTSVTESNDESSTTTGKNNVKKSKSNKTKIKQHKKIPPDPPPPDYKNDGFDDDEGNDEDFYNELKDERKSRDRIYDRLESPK